MRWAAGDEPRIWWCVGAAFEAPAGTRPRAPEWMRRAGLEWLFRLALEPRRLARRYLVGNPRFVWCYGADASAERWDRLIARACGVARCARGSERSPNSPPTGE